MSPDVEPTEGGNCYHCGRVGEVDRDDGDPCCPDCGSMLQWIAGGQHTEDAGNCYVCAGVDEVEWDGDTARCLDCGSVLQWIAEDGGDDE